MQDKEKSHFYCVPYANYWTTRGFFANSKVGQSYRQQFLDTKQKWDTVFNVFVIIILTTPRHILMKASSLLQGYLYFFRKGQTKMNELPGIVLSAFHFPQGCIPLTQASAI